MGYSPFFFLDMLSIGLKQVWENKDKSDGIISSNGTIKLFIKFCPWCFRRPEYKELTMEGIPRSSFTGKAVYRELNTLFWYIPQFSFYSAFVGQWVDNTWQALWEKNQSLHSSPIRIDKNVSTKTSCILWFLMISMKLDFCVQQQKKKGYDIHRFLLSKRKSRKICLSWPPKLLTKLFFFFTTKDSFH